MQKEGKEKCVVRKKEKKKKKKEKWASREPGSRKKRGVSRHFFYENIKNGGKKVWKNT